MNKEHVLKIILVASIPVMLFTWGKNLGCYPKRSPRPQVKDVSQTKGQTGQPVPQEGQPAAGGPRQSRHTKYTTWGRPPFRVGVVAQAAMAPLTLEGIVMDPLVPTAIINGEIKKEGDEIAGATVVLIQKTKVVLKKDKQEIVLELFQQ